MIMDQEAFTKLILRMSSLVLKTIEDGVVYFQRLIEPLKE